MPDRFISCDWGTTRFRLRLCRTADAASLARFESDRGAGQLAGETELDRPRRFAAALEDGLLRLAERGEPLGSAPIVISGMASSSIGWRELPYAKVPWRVDGSDLVCEELEPVASGQGVHRVILVSGARTPRDVMRGEETQVVGLAQLPALGRLRERALVILPGTHSKHVRIEQDQVVDFQTFMTGELFDALSRHSVLRHSIGAEPDAAELSGERLASFHAGVDEGASRPLSAALFRVRTRALLDQVAPLENREFMSGLLIASELAHLRHEERGVPIVLCAAGALQSYYVATLARLGVADRLTVVAAEDVERLTVLGQASLLGRLGA